MKMSTKIAKAGPVLAIASMLLAATGLTAGATTAPEPTDESPASAADPSEPASGTAAATTDTAAIDSQLDELYQAARDAGESELTVYGPSAPALQAYVDVFNERFLDVSVNLVSLIGADLASRLGAETASGQVEGDLVFGPTGQGIFTAEYDDWFEPFEPAGAAQVSDDVRHPEGLWNGVWSSVFGWVYNTDRLDESEVPTTWTELITEEWRGRVGMDDPSVRSASSVSFAYALGDGQIDEEWLVAMAANDPVMLIGPARRSEGILTGEVDVALYPAGVMAVEVATGAPLEIVPDSVVTIPHGFGVIAGAPHPNAARLFYAWLYTPEAQASFAPQGNFGLMPGAPAPADGVEFSTALSAEEFGELHDLVLETWAGTS